MCVLIIYSNHTHDLLPAPPIGLSYAASAAADTAHEVRFVDMLVIAAWLRELQQFKPDFFAISVHNIEAGRCFAGSGTIQ